MKRRLLIYVLLPAVLLTSVTSSHSMGWLKRAQDFRKINAAKLLGIGAAVAAGYGIYRYNSSAPAQALPTYVEYCTQQNKNQFPPRIPFMTIDPVAQYPEITSLANHVNARSPISSQSSDDQIKQLEAAVDDVVREMVNIEQRPVLSQYIDSHQSVLRKKADLTSSHLKQARKRDQQCETKGLPRKSSKEIREAKEKLTKPEQQKKQVSFSDDLATKKPCSSSFTRVAALRNHFESKNSESPKQKIAGCSRSIIGAVKNNKYEVAMKLLKDCITAEERHEMLMMTDSEGNTPLHCAIQKNDCQMINVLLQNVKDKTGRIMCTLIYDFKNNAGFSAMDLARYLGCEKGKISVSIVTLLTEYNTRGNKHYNFETKLK